MNEIIDFKNWFVSKFENSLNGGNSKPFNLIRKDALEKFSQLKFPTTKDEEWRFTNISPLLKYNFNPAISKQNITAEEIERFLFNNSFKNQLIFIDGYFAAELSAVNGVSKKIKLGNLASAFGEDSETVQKHLGKYADYQNQIFTALNTAYAKDGAFIFIPDGEVIEEPVHVLFIATSKIERTLIQPRNLFIAGKNSQATIIEHYVSLDDNLYFTNAVSEIVVGENATLNHIKIQEESRIAFHVSRTEIDQERSSNFESVAISFGAEISRNDITSRFNNEGGECTLNGLFLLDGSQLFDTHTMIDHAKPYCNSHEHYKGILDGKSRGVFNGKVMVRPNAQKTNAFQENNNIILSNEALVNTKPQLEIFADDVKCSHGATIGQLDEDSMFYLKSRGIGEETARTILIHAFASDVVKSIKVDAIKNYLEEILDKRFNKES
ncbi:MAG: Fe-S cluster assembly protein SufD [Ignavibacteriaceae bacterium]